MHFSNVVFLVFDKVVAPWLSDDYGIRTGGSLPCTTDTPNHNDVPFVHGEVNP